MARITDPSCDLVGEIFSRVPLRSLNAVRSTCKTWKALSKNQMLGQKSAKKQFMAFMMIENHYSIYSLRFDLQGIRNENYCYDEDVGNHTSMPTHQVEISQIFHCDGLLLCVTLDQSRLFVCNPYLEQSRLVQTRNKFHRKSDMYVLGYDNNNNNHKILSFSIADRNIKDVEVYCFSSDTWRVLDVGPMHCHPYDKFFVPLKGNTYFCSPDHEGKYGLVCFDFTTERFGPLLPMPEPFHEAYYRVTDIISSNEKLVLLHNAYIREKAEIWITTKIEPNVVLVWNKFLTLNYWYFSKGLFPKNYWCNFDCRSWFIDEEKKVVVFLDITPKTCLFQMAYIIGEDRYFRSVNLGTAPDLEWVYQNIQYYIYVPSLVQLQV